MIGSNVIDDTIAVWKQVEKAKCTPSKIVRCQEEPLIVSLSTLSCIEQLLSSCTVTSNVCEVTRSFHSTTAMFHLTQNIWVFYDTHRVQRCNIFSYKVNSFETLIISEPSLTQLPCEATIKCSDSRLQLPLCRREKKSIMLKVLGNIKTAVHRRYSFRSLKKKLEAKYKANARLSLEKLQLGFYDHESIKKKKKKKKKINVLLKMSVYVCLFVVLIITMAITKLLKSKLQKHIKNTQKEMNKLSEIFLIDIYIRH